MKKILIILLAAAWSLALAQAPTDEPSPPEADPSGEPAGVEPEDDLATGAGEVEPDPEIEASVEEVFRPGDEISEDYPVPLPADI